MPELPEVETLNRQLQKKISGRAISATEVYDDKLTGIKNFQAGKVAGVERQGKTICIRLEDGRSIVIHLRMTGRLLWQESAERPRHSRWRAGFDKGNIFLVDPRRFATIRIERTKTEKIKNDLMADFDEKLFLAKQANRKINLKTLLMDQKALAGIGNIYACEILHRSGISPLRQAASLSIREWKMIFDSAKRILKKGIENRGTSISDWRDLYGLQGENQKELKVYGQQGKYCSTCGGTINRIKQGGRSTFYCHTCQK
ncbi:MAG: bifunctional DNA-formamidopyrimidine glycosylase/DNA-(apurinic or apyrimidinic site) lyase [Deltaproteobacteria bacterium]|nr:bifunctional DNA-formamidopyrimidine glycosylase/DNA-(apurinic or apyrimidinic site) lyase [Deltaproteobacteria bacterium]